jgi:hypothetical protein
VLNRSSLPHPSNVSFKTSFEITFGGYSGRFTIGTNGYFKGYLFFEPTRAGKIRAILAYLEFGKMAFALCIQCHLFAYVKIVELLQWQYLLHQSQLYHEDFSIRVIAG